MRPLILTILLIISSLIPLHAVTYYFDGALSDNLGIWQAGLPFSGSFSYDYPQTPSFTGYVYASYFATSLTFNIGSATSGSQGLTIYADNIPRLDIYNKIESIFLNGVDTGSYPHDQFELSFPVGNYLGDKYINSIRISLTDFSGQIFSSTSLITGTMRLSDFSSALLYISYQDGPTEGIPQGWGRVDSYITSLIPEPSALSLLAVGLSGLAMIRRRSS